MMKQCLKEKKGISTIDIIVAMTILSIFVGVIGNLYYQIALQNNIIRMNAVAVYYVVKIAEDIDKMPYEEVSNDLGNRLKTTYGIPDILTMTIDVQQESQKDPTKEDIIKTVTIRAEYTCFGNQRFYEIKKLKIKEIAKENI